MFKRYNLRCANGVIIILWGQPRSCLAMHISCSSIIYTVRAATMPGSQCLRPGTFVSAKRTFSSAAKLLCPIARRFTVATLLLAYDCKKKRKKEAVLLQQSQLCSDNFTALNVQLQKRGSSFCCSKVNFAVTILRLLTYSCKRRVQFCCSKVNFAVTILRLLTYSCKKKKKKKKKGAVFVVAKSPL